MRKKKKHLLWAGLAMLSGLLLLGCKSEDPSASVARSALQEGMTTNAVLSAWGRPTIVSSISTPNGPFIVWEYYRHRLVTVPTAQPQVIVPWSSTPVPENRAYPQFTRPPDDREVEWLDRSAVFHNERLVNWSPK